MTRNQKRIEYVLIPLALTSLGFGVKTMLSTPTWNLPAWFLTMMYAGSLLIIAFGLGYLFSVLSKSRVRIITAASLIIFIVCAAYYFEAYRPTYKIIVPAKFSGEVKLFRSTLTKDLLVLDQFGVGYITDKNYRRGFVPAIYQNGREITKDCQNIIHGSLGYAAVDGSSFGPYEYFGFTVPGKSSDSIWNDLNKVLQLKAIDTSIIKK